MSTNLRGKKRKRRSFLQTQNRFGKQGRYGRGTSLDADNYQYFLRILEVMRDSENNQEEMEMLATNVFEEIKGKEIEYSGNQLASRVIEKLLPFTTDDSAEVFMNTVTENLRPLFTDPYISHILQSIALLGTQRYIKLCNQTSENGDNKFGIFYLDVVLKISRFALNNLEDYVWDQYANHIIRTLLQCLSGNPVKGNMQSSTEQVTSPVPSQCAALLEQYATRLLSWPQFHELLTEEITSGLIQSLLISLKQSKKLTRMVVKKIMEKFDDSNSNLTSDNNQAILRLIETVIVCGREKSYLQVYDKFFKDKLPTLALSHTCNFAVQKLLIHCRSKEMFESLFIQLQSVLKEVLKAGHTGVLWALAQGCNKHKTKQGDFVMVLSDVLECQHPEDRAMQIVPLASCLTPLESYSAESSKINLHGSLIIQEMLQFNKPIRIVNSLLEMDTIMLQKLLCDPRGSHIADVYLKSQFVGEKSREKLFKKLKGHYATLVMSKHGSRSFDAVWNAISVKQKLIVMEALKSKQSEIMADQFGRVIAYKVRLDYFRQNRDAWIKHANSISSKEKVFSDIVSTKKFKRQ